MIYRKYFDTLSALFATLGILFLFLQTRFVNVSFFLSVLFTVLAGNWHEKWQIIKRDKIVYGGIVLLVLFAIGVFYQLVPLKIAVQGFTKYAKLFYLIFLVPLFVREAWRNMAIYALLIGVIVNALVAILCKWHIGFFANYTGIIGGYFVHPIYVGVGSAFSLFILACLIADKARGRNWYIALFVFLGYTSFFVYIERTGYLIAFVLFILFISQRWHWRGVIIALLLTTALVSGLYKFSTVFHQRVNEGVVNVHEYADNKRDTSWGYRLEFAKYSFDIIKKHPVFGSGTGSFPLLYSTTNGPVLEKNKLLGHPHNEYILVMFQLGAVGLLVFLGWIALQWYYSYRLPLFYRRLAQGLIVTFVVNSFCNVSLYINATGMLYVVFLSIFISSCYKKEDN